ncbi:MAG: hypothetical protein WDM85_00110 [Caulobacteraceae bacterium]
MLSIDACGGWQRRLRASSQDEPGESESTANARGVLKHFTGVPVACRAPSSWRRTRHGISPAVAPEAGDVLAG